MINYIYINLKKSVLFLGYENVTHSVRIFGYSNVTQSALFFNIKMSRKVHYF